MSYLFMVGMFCLMLAAAAVAWAYSTFGSVRAAAGYASGHHLTTATAVIDLGEVKPGESHPFVVRVLNNSPHPYQIVGSNNLCLCVIETDLPTRVPANGAVDIDLTLLVPRSGKPGNAGCLIELVTDSPRDVLLLQPVRYATH